MESYNICPFVSGLFYMAYFQDSSMLLHMSELYPFLLLNNMLLCIYMYTHTYIIEYTVAIILSKIFEKNNNGSVRPIKNKKNKTFCFTCTCTYFNSLPLCGSRFWTCITFLLFKKDTISCKASLLATNFINFCLSKKVFLFHF